MNKKKEEINTLEVKNVYMKYKKKDKHFALNDVNINQSTYFYNLNKSITNIETDRSTNRKVFSIDQTTQYIPIGRGVSTNDTKIKIKDGIYGALNAYNNNILKSI